MTLLRHELSLRHIIRQWRARKRPRIIQSSSLPRLLLSHLSLSSSPLSEQTMEQSRHFLCHYLLSFCIGIALRMTLSLMILPPWFKIPTFVGNHPCCSCFKNDFWATPLQDTLSNKSFRPLTTLSYRWSLALFGMNPRHFHFVNILLNATCAYLLVKCVQHHDSFASTRGCFQS